MLPTRPGLQRHVPEPAVLSGQRVPLTQALTQVKQKVEAEAVNPLVQGGQKVVFWRAPIVVRP